MKLFKVLVVALMLLISSSTVNAADIYVGAEENSQGAVWEYYVRTETVERHLHAGNGKGFSVKVYRIGKDKWTKGYPPVEFTYTFFREAAYRYYSVYNNTAERSVGQTRPLPAAPKFAKTKEDARAMDVYIFTQTNNRLPDL